ncbi:MAG: Endonuclease/Exonuclease/phosphatase family protein [Chthoniobacteraceae bacterium]|nr:Endonuclease/Exonuclease/phosphatase family protein [Chthoniobacteraceae bacterium]
MKRISFLALFLAFGAAAALLMSAEPRGLVICQYNLENYVGEDQAALGERRARPKSEKEIAALIRIIKEINPDILGVCEMGSREKFVDFAARLKGAGLGYIDSEYVDGPDRDRHLALFSRFPIVGRQSLADVPFSIGGIPEKVRRGFLDVTIQVNGTYQLRMIGAHLKSKLLAAEDEAIIRRHEAHELRKHLDEVLRASPDVNLVCYGDFNDLKNTPGFREITGERGSPGYMADLWASDAEGDRWTHFWRSADLYSRIDFILVNNGALREVVREKSTVYRSPYWNEASDHRPVYATFMPVERR